jgi:hypothetical protein
MGLSALLAREKRCIIISHEKCYLSGKSGLVLPKYPVFKHSPEKQAEYGEWNNPGAGPILMDFISQ